MSHSSVKSDGGGRNQHTFALDQRPKKGGVEKKHKRRRKMYLFVDNLVYLILAICTSKV